MIRSAHRAGIDIIGAAAPPRAILIRVRNAGDVARKQGALASLATALVPATVEARVYEEMAARLDGDLKANGIDAEVSVIADASRPSSPGAGDGGAFLRGAAVGVGGAGVVWLAWRFVFRRFIGGK